MSARPGLGSRGRDALDWQGLSGGGRVPRVRRHPRTGRLTVWGATNEIERRAIRRARRGAA